MDTNEFFKEATLRICGSLEIERSLHSTLLFLKSVVPVDIMFLERYDTDAASTRTIARAEVANGTRLDLLTPLTPAAREWAALYRTNKTKAYYLYQDPDSRPYASEMMRFHGIKLNSVIVMPLKSGGLPIGSLIVGSEAGRFTTRDAEIITSLNEPFALAMSNALQYNELKHLKDLLADDNKYLQKELRNISGIEIIGANHGLKDVMQKVKQVADSDSPVLLLGETGVGKDLIANAIHYSSPRSSGPMITVNCGAIPESLIDSELFGHEKGAFTGALSQKRGRFERADNGSIFLDEIGELPLQAQVRFLRVLQDKIIERVGGTKSIKLDIRVIAATNKDLHVMISNKEFREDLWYRLSVFPIYIPPLRERKIDIPALLQYLLERKADELNLPALPEVDPEGLDRLTDYDWPGNVRELQNVVERELIINPKGPLYFENISPTTVKAGNIQKDKPSEKSDESVHLDSIVASHIEKVLHQAGGRIHGVGGAAELLGINPSTLRNRMDKLGISYKRNE